MTNEQKLRDINSIFDKWIRAYSGIDGDGDHIAVGALEHARNEIREALSLQPPTSDEGTPLTDAEIKRSVGIASMSGMEQAWEDMCHFAKELERTLHAKERELETLRKDIETGFMEGAYACLKTLQTAEQEALQSVSAAPQEGKCTCKRYTEPPVLNGVVIYGTCPIHAPPPATPRGDGGEVIKHKPDCPSIPDDPFGHPSVVAECDCNAPPAATDSFVPGLANILREAAAIISNIDPQHAPGNIRWPIVDELHGFAGMVEDAAYGFVIVPIEPTEEMIDKGYAEVSGYGDPGVWMVKLWKAMLAAGKKEDGQP